MLKHGGDIDLGAIFPCGLARLGVESGDVVLRIPTADDNAFAVGDGRGDGLLGGARLLPDRFAGEWIEAGGEFAAGEEHLIAARYLEDDRRRVVRQLRPTDLPY